MTKNTKYLAIEKLLLTVVEDNPNLAPIERTEKLTEILEFILNVSAAIITWDAPLHEMGYDPRDVFQAAEYKARHDTELYSNKCAIEHVRQFERIMVILRQW